MDLVYSCRPGQNEELRYSIRSAIKNLSHDNIWVIGGKPDWYKGNYIEVKDVGNKFTNISNCLKVATESELISDNFIFMNDDFYILDKINNLPVLHGGSLRNKVAEYQELVPGSLYSRVMSKTEMYLKKYGIDNALDYDIHVPMEMNKDKLKVALKSKCQPRSVYGNIFNIGGKEISDVKFYKNGPLTERSLDYKSIELPMISSQDDSFDSIKKDILDNLFKEKSKYEL